MKRIRRERGFSVNPWSTHTRWLVSHRLLIDEAYAGPLRDWLGTFRSGTLFILDEAHHAAPASGQRYAIDSQITGPCVTSPHGLSTGYSCRPRRTTDTPTVSRRYSKSSIPSGFAGCARRPETP